MNKYFMSITASLLALSLLVSPVLAQTGGTVVFWSTGGPVPVERPTGRSATARLDALLAGPTAEERLRGLWTAIPAGTTLANFQIAPSDTEDPSRPTLTVRLTIPATALHNLNHETHEVIVQQIGGTLNYLNWYDLHIETWDPTAKQFVPLSDLLPEITVPHQETVEAEPDIPALSPIDRAAQPPAQGQGQPQGALSGKTVYVSAGHGWEWDCSYWRWDEELQEYICAGEWRWEVQRIPYPRPPYVGPIIEDFNNAEAVNQYLLQYLWNAGARVVPVRERDINPTEVIVNNDGDPGYSETGTWTTGSAPGYDTHIADQTYRYANAVTTTATATATWAATLPADGRYAVYVWYYPSANRTTDARYTVHHAGGATMVTVNQQINGSTWNYIGTYGFRSGEEARVTLSNLSSTAPAAVIADAVRFGGGTYDQEIFDSGWIDTSADYPPNTPWWDVSSYYYTQRMGMHAPPGDVTARPIYARWDRAGSDLSQDAVYVSWHTNGYSGYQWDYRGTMSIIHNGEGNPVTPGSYDLRAAIHDELLNDIRAGWDPTWPSYLRQMNLGELRELWDPDADPESDPDDDIDASMPGALIEIAYHDHPDDTDALKEPAFLLLASRAVYQGILHYFDTGATELPEPPTHLAVENAGGGEVRVSWQPSPTDTVGLVGDAAAGYRVYTSPDGLGWSNGIDVGATTAYTLTGLSSNQLLFIRVTATNAGGESFPTETLAVRVGDTPGILLVNGFDRLNRSMTVPDYYTHTAEVHQRVYLDQMNHYGYVVHHGEVISYPFDSTSNEAIQASHVSLDDYGIVDWILGEESTADETLNATEQVLLASFLSGGGSLFISGSEIGWDLDHLGDATDQSFYQAVLRAGYAGDDAGTYEVSPAAGSIFDGLPAIRFDAPGEYDVDYADQITPLNGSTAALTYQGGLGGTAAIQYEYGCQHLVHFGFPFEAIRPDQREAVMAQVLDFLDECTIQPLQTTIVSPLDGSLHQSTPAFTGTASGGSGVAGVEVSVCRQADGLCWNGTTWTAAPIWLAATGTTAWSYPLPNPLDEGWYDLQAQSKDTLAYSDPTPATATFQIVQLNNRVFLPLILRTVDEPVCTDAIGNGGFEEEGGWTFNHLAVYDVTVVHSGARSVRVGIPPGEPGGNDLIYSSIRQQVTLPAGSSATLDLWLYPINENDDPNDVHYITLFDESGGYHGLATWRSDARAWQHRAYDLTPYLGQTVSIYIGTKNDGNDDTSALYIDDVSLEVCP